MSEQRSETIWQMLQQSATLSPTRDALVAADDGGETSRISYVDLVERATALSAGLAGIGVRRGDRVVIWMTNRIEWVISYLATVRLGAAIVPVNTFLRPPEIAYIIQQSGARHLIMIDSFRQLDMAAMLTEICPAFGATHKAGELYDEALPDLRNVIVFNRHDDRTDERVHDWRALARGEGEGAAALADSLAAKTRLTDLAMVKYTSGSTGFPKGVMLEQGGIILNGRMHSRRVGITSDDVFFSMMPFFHGGGSIWGLTTMLVNHSTLVFTEAFAPHYAVDLIETYRPTVMMGVLAQEVIDEANKRGKIFPSLRIGHLPPGGPDPVMPNVTFGIFPFGLTETYGPAATNSPNDPVEKRFAFSGRMLDGNEMRVVDPETEQDVPPGTPGEAWLRGNIMRGYWNKPEATAKVLRPDGWLRSEDIVQVDDEGYITYVGRLKLMLKVGGENVSIEEIEKVVASHPDVEHCAVIGVPDARKVERARAYAALRPGREITEEQLLAWLKPRLAVFKMPREILFLDAIPRLGNGKIDRVSLQNAAREEQVV